MQFLLQDIKKYRACKASPRFCPSAEKHFNFEPQWPCKNCKRPQFRSAPGAVWRFPIRPPYGFNRQPALSSSYATTHRQKPASPKTPLRSHTARRVFLSAFCSPMLPPASATSAHKVSCSLSCGKWRED